MANEQVYYDPAKGLYYTQKNASVAQAGNPNFYMNTTNGMNLGTMRNYLGSPTSGQPSQNLARPQFTPNKFTQSQLQGAGGGLTPQWMMDAYTRKIGQMGGNANQPPFGVTQSGFPGAGGKSAPAQ